MQKKFEIFLLTPTIVMHTTDKGNIIITFYQFFLQVQAARRVFLIQVIQHPYL